MVSKESESYRLNMLRQLQGEDQQSPPPKVAEAEKVIAQYRARQQQCREQIARLGTPLPNPDACPSCYYDHGHTSIMTPQPSESDADIFACNCGYSEERSQ